jgi:hypothetical protein
LITRERVRLTGAGAGSPGRFASLMAPPGWTDWRRC